MTHKLMSRTFWLTVSVFLVSTLLLIGGYIPAEVWGNTVMWVLSSYALKSVGDKYVTSDRVPKNQAR